MIFHRWIFGIPFQPNRKIVSILKRNDRGDRFLDRQCFLGRIRSSPGSALKVPPSYVNVSVTVASSDHVNDTD